MLQFIADSRHRSPARPARAAYAGLMRRLARHARVRMFRIFVRKLDPAAGAAPPPRLDYRWLRVNDALALCADASLDLDEAKIRAAYGRGDRCIGAFDGAQLAAYCWFAMAAAPHMDQAWLEFPPAFVYTYKSYVRPAYRGRGIAAAMYRAADAVFLQRGCRAALICAESHNWPSFAAAARAGFEPAGYAAYADGAHLRVWRSPAAARHGLRFYRPR
jgi:ribosomal protein S18 acetylase RimI-like enzyme